MRHEVVKVFQSTTLPHLLSDRPRVAVVGGSPAEPELVSLPVDATIDYFGVEDTIGDSRFTYLDLNLLRTDLPANYDLVICSQVLEHVYDVRNAIENLLRLASPSGLVWIACPASNFAHGSPDYFSAGYTPELICNLAVGRGARLVASGCLGSRRNYLWTHLIRQWPTEEQLARPVSTAIRSALVSEGPLWKRLARSVKATRTVIFLPFDNRLRSDIYFATESWVLVRNPDVPFPPA